MLHFKESKLPNVNNTEVKPSSPYMFNPLEGFVKSLLCFALVMVFGFLVYINIYRNNYEASLIKEVHLRDSIICLRDSVINSQNEFLDSLLKQVRLSDTIISRKQFYK